MPNVTEIQAGSDAVRPSAKREQAVQRLLEACMQRFEPPAFAVGSDDAGVVWIKRTDRRMSLGLQPWLLRGRSIEEVLDRAETKLQQ